VSQFSASTKLSGDLLHIATKGRDTEHASSFSPHSGRASRMETVARVPTPERPPLMSDCEVAAREARLRRAQELYAQGSETCSPAISCSPADPRYHIGNLADYTSRSRGSPVNLQSPDLPIPASVVNKSTPV